jgi:hypothetical protein
VPALTLFKGIASQDLEVCFLVSLINLKLHGVCSFAFKITFSCRISRFSRLDVASSLFESSYRLFDLQQLLS